MDCFIKLLSLLPVFQNPSINTSNEAELSNIQLGQFANNSRSLNLIFLLDGPPRDKIIKYLDVQSLLNLRMTCKDYMRIGTNELIQRWKILQYHDGQIYPPIMKKYWKMHRKLDQTGFQNQDWMPATLIMFGDKDQLNITNMLTPCQKLIVTSCEDHLNILYQKRGKDNARLHSDTIDGSIRNGIIIPSMRPCRRPSIVHILKYVNICYHLYLNVR
ncbi:unnamed protein product [Thelazia callipaeda]|uniref:F-box domain-containing protein n=1 Tax=Thelazia callipaeda TaxID=103827 RepID=A0A0N5CT21_THECL|nr:unnamed protein product [Thelazia callipaeda]